MLELYFVKCRLSCLQQSSDRGVVFWDIEDLADTFGFVGKLDDFLSTLDLHLGVRLKPNCLVGEFAVQEMLIYFFDDFLDKYYRD
jgi:hypothetical protein